MPDWNELLDEIQAIRGQAQHVHDALRRRLLGELYAITGRNTILYYSGWLQKPEDYSKCPWEFTIHDADKTGFMSAIHGLDRDLGLDLILHTPGGDVAATESLVDYLRSMFGTDIRAIIPQMAMSGGTMIALACSQIVMGKQSSIGPIDPQKDGKPAHGILDEFNQARSDIAKNPNLALAWQPIIAKYAPTLIGECGNAIKWAEEMARQWLVTGMFARRDDPEKAAAEVIRKLGSPNVTKAHNRHISVDAARDMGLDVVSLEDDQNLQDAVLSLHHAVTHTLTGTHAVKIIENHEGRAYVRVRQPALVLQQQG